MLSTSVNHQTINLDLLRDALSYACGSDISMHYRNGVFYCFSTKLALSDGTYSERDLRDYSTFIYTVNPNSSVIAFAKSRYPMDEVMDKLSIHGFTAAHI